MTEGSEAAEQVVRMMLSGGEVAVRLSGSALKNGGALMLALAKNHKKVFGRVNLRKMLMQTRDIRTFAMTPEQFVSFKKHAKSMRILYSAVRDKNDIAALVDVILPVSELERANVVLEKIRYAPQAEHTAEHETGQDREQEPKNASRSESDSRDTRDNSSTHSEKSRTTSERPSIERKLMEHKETLEQRKQRRTPARQRQKTKGRMRGRTK